LDVKKRFSEEQIIGLSSPEIRQCIDETESLQERNLGDCTTPAYSCFCGGIQAHARTSSCDIGLSESYVRVHHHLGWYIRH
jgi:hypothetical protein